MTLHLQRLPSVAGAPQPTVLRSAWHGGLSAAVEVEGAVTLLVAAPTGPTVVGAHDELVAQFERQARRVRGLPMLALELDSAVREIGAGAVCATLLEVGPRGLRVLHRGNPAPLVVRHDGQVRAVQARVPGPPLGTRGGGDDEPLEVPAGDLVVLTTPGGADQLLPCLLGVPAVPQAIWQALSRQVGADAVPGAQALVAPGGTTHHRTLGSAAKVHAPEDGRVSRRRSA